MSYRPRVLHVIDDATAGGVMRVVDFITSSDALAETARHDVHQIQRGRFRSIPKDVDIIVSHTTISWRALPSLMALRASRPDTPIIHVEHSYTAGFVAHNVTRKGRFMSLLKVGFSLFDRVVAVSEAQSNWMIARNLCPAERLVTIPSCVDLTPFRAVPAASGQIRTLGAIGRLDRQKGFDSLIEAFKRTPGPELRLRIIGQGAEERALKTLAAGDHRIVFAGQAADPVQALGGVDAVVMPSRWEAFGLVAIEALAAKRTLLCAKVDGLTDHEKHGARYYDARANGSLHAALRNLISAHEASEEDLQAQHSVEPEAEFQGSWSALIRSMEVTAPNRTAIVQPDLSSSVRNTRLLPVSS